MLSVNNCKNQYSIPSFCAKECLYNPCRSVGRLFYFFTTSLGWYIKNQGNLEGVEK
jgi:hypothetical protein